MYKCSELKKLWEKEELSADQVIAQLICYIEAHDALLLDLQRRVENLERPAPQSRAAPPKRTPAKAI